MGACLAIACVSRLWRLSYPERGATEWIEANLGPSAVAGFRGLPLTVFPGVVRCSQEDRCRRVKKMNDEWQTEVSANK